LRDAAMFAALRCACAVVERLPEALIYRAAGLVGGCLVRMSAHRSRCALDILGNAFPHASRRSRLRLAREGAGNLAKVMIDLIRVDRAIARGVFRDRVDMSALAAIDLPPPWIGVTAHLGSWECGAIGVARLGVKTHVTARALKNPLAQQWLSANRLRSGLVVHDRRGGIRALARALDSGCIALQVVDQNQRTRGVFAPFFGKLASTERAAATLAVRKRYPIVVAAMVRVGVGFRFKFVVQEILTPDAAATTADASAADPRAPAPDASAGAVERLVARINRSLESLIRRYPEQYLWIHDRYRTRPAVVSPTA
jgi:KDO2-lipid IV(A) lauroyltransferase